MTLDVNELDTAYDLYGHYNSGGSFFFGNDSTLDDLTHKMIREFDNKKRISMAHDLQKHEAKVQWLPAITAATLIKIGWPAERIPFNTVSRGNPSRWHAHTWLDKTQAPFKR